MKSTRFFAGLVSLGAMLGYLANMQTYAGWTLLQPRGGLVMLAASLAIANPMIWLSGNPDLSLNVRFQLAAAGWIWILVQAGAQVYLYAVST